jgi:hypothetical protein
MAYHIPEYMKFRVSGSSKKVMVTVLGLAGGGGVGVGSGGGAVASGGEVAVGAAGVAGAPQAVSRTAAMSNVANKVQNQVRFITTLLLLRFGFWGLLALRELPSSSPHGHKRIRKRDTRHPLSPQLSDP